MSNAFEILKETKNLKEKLEDKDKLMNNILDTFKKNNKISDKNSLLRISSILFKKIFVEMNLYEEESNGETIGFYFCIDGFLEKIKNLLKGGL